MVKRSLTVLALRAIVYQLILIVTVIPYSFACLIWAPLPLDWRYRLTSGWPRFAVWVAQWVLGVRWEVKGLNRLPATPAVILSKHQSDWETMFYLAYLLTLVCCVFKLEHHRLLFLGLGLTCVRMITYVHMPCMLTMEHDRRA